MLRQMGSTSAKRAIHAIALCSPAALILTWGCSRASPAAMATNVVAAPVYELADAADRPQRFRKLFVEGAVPNDQQRRRFGQLILQVSKVISVSDSEATLHVLVDSDKGDRVGEVDWTVIREGDAWKLKTAPLP